MATADTETPPIDERTAAWRALSAVERLLIRRCDVPGYITEGGRLAAGLLAVLRDEQSGETVPPKFWHERWRP